MWQQQVKKEGLYHTASSHVNKMWGGHVARIEKKLKQDFGGKI
jgi:hypothetical protein